MAKTISQAARQKLEARILTEYRTLFDPKAKGLAGSEIHHREQDYVDAFYENVFEALGIDAGDEKPPVELQAFADWVCERWDGETIDE
jgi:hypothetical protein